MARKPKKSEVNTNEWMNTYADTVTLLLCFFVLLFSFSTINEKKWKEIVEALRYKPPASEQKLNLENLDPSKLDVKGTMTPSDSKSTEEAQDLLYRTIKNYIQENNLESKIELIKGDDMVTIRFKDTILFNPDRTELREDGKVILNDISKVLLSSIDIIKMINIQGHTASTPKGQPEFQNTFEFSTKRAVNVLEYMISTANMDPFKLSAIGYGQYHPIESNETEEGRSRNRRVEIIVESYPIEKNISVEPSKNNSKK